MTSFNFRQIIKLDLDLNDRDEVMEQVKSRLSFLVKIDLFEWKLIEKVELLFKTTYSCRIFINKKFTNPRDLIIIQSILGSEYKHIAITFRDYLEGSPDYNKLFTIKKYVNGDYIEAQIEDITKDILTKEEYK